MVFALTEGTGIMRFTGRMELSGWCLNWEDLDRYSGPESNKDAQ